jgi:DNA-binding MarR family transcriptional regulator
MAKVTTELEVPPSLEREWGRLRRGHLMQLLRASSEPGLSPLAVELLRAVVETGEVRASELASALLVTKTSISRYVNEMLDEGLLEQRKDPTDGRAILLSVSVAGREALAERELRRTAVLHEWCAGWSPTDVALLTALLKKFNDAAQAHRTQQLLR